MNSSSYILLALLTIFAFTAPALAQDTQPDLGGNYELTQPDGSPAISGHSTRVSVFNFGAQTIFMVWIKKDGQSEWHNIPGETFAVPIETSTSHDFVNVNGTSGTLEWNDEDDQYEVLITSGKSKGRRTVMTPE